MENQSPYFRKSTTPYFRKPTTYTTNTKKNTTYNKGEFGIVVSPAFPLSTTNNNTANYITKIFYRKNNVTSLIKKRSIIKDIFGQSMLRYQVTLKNIKNRNSQLANYIHKKNPHNNIFSTVKMPNLGIALNKLTPEMITHPISIPTLVVECQTLLYQLVQLAKHNLIHGDLHTGNIVLHLERLTTIVNNKSSSHAISIIDFDILCSINEYVDNEHYMKYLFPTYRSPPEACSIITELYTLAYDCKSEYYKDIVSMYPYYWKTVPQLNTLDATLHNIFTKWDKYTISYRNQYYTILRQKNAEYTTTMHQNNINNTTKKHKMKLQNMGQDPEDVVHNTNYKRKINTINNSYKPYNTLSENIRKQINKMHYKPYIKNICLTLIKSIDSFSLGMALVELFAILFPSDPFVPSTLHMYTKHDIDVIQSLRSICKNMAHLEFTNRINCITAYQQMKSL